MTKEMILQQYHTAMLDFTVAATEDEKWKARIAMAGLERTAAELYGFDFVDEIRVAENLEPYSSK